MWIVSYSLLDIFLKFIVKPTLNTLRLVTVQYGSGYRVVLIYQVCHRRANNAARKDSTQDDVVSLFFFKNFTLSLIHLSYNSVSN